MSKRRTGKSPSADSRALLALRELCTRLGYCDALYEVDSIFEDPPKDPHALIDAVFRAEGKDPSLAPREERRQMVEIVNRWAVYDDPPANDPLSARPRFPSTP